MDGITRLREKRYAANCDRCDDFFAFPANNHGDAKAFIERCGWQLTSDHDWLCKDCLLATEAAAPAHGGGDASGCESDE